MKEKRKTKLGRSFEVITGASSTPWTTASPGDLAPLLSCKAEGQDLPLGRLGLLGQCFLVCALDQHGESHPNDQVQRDHNFWFVVVFFFNFSFFFKFNFYLYVIYVLL